MFNLVLRLKTWGQVLQAHIWLNISPAGHAVYARHQYWNAIAPNGRYVQDGG